MSPHYTDTWDEGKRNLGNRYEAQNEWSNEFKKRHRALDPHNIFRFKISCAILSAVSHHEYISQQVPDEQEPGKLIHRVEVNHTGYEVFCIQGEIEITRTHWLP